MAEKKCVKCGRNAAEDQAFCPECLAEMEKYPVKPGVVVLLPRRDQNQKPPSRRRHPSVTPEEQIQKLKQHILALWLALILALGAAGALGWIVVTDYMEAKETDLLPGQNYSSETSGTEINPE